MKPIPVITPRTLFVVTAVALAWLAAGVAPAADFYATLAFEQEGLNLETQAVEQAELHGTFRDAVDFHLGYHADRANHIVLVQNQQSQVLIAFLDNEPFELVDATMIGNLTFTDSLMDVPLDANDTIVLLTSEGHHYKVGNAVDNGDGTVTVQSADL